MSSSQDSSQNKRVSRLLNANAKSKDGQSLGEVEDLIIDPATGKIQFVVLGQGGVLGIGEDLVPVPWQSVSVQPNGEIRVNQDKQKLGSAPSLRKDYSNLNEPTYTVTIYEFYAIPAGGMGGGESPGSMESGGSQDASGLSNTNSSTWDSTTKTNE